MTCLFLGCLIGHLVLLSPHYSIDISPGNFPSLRNLTYVRPACAQAKIGAAERRTKLLEEKNENLQKELDNWNEEATLEYTSNLQSVASGSGLPYFGFSSAA